MLSRKTSQVAKKSAKERLGTSSPLHLLTPRMRARWDTFRRKSLPEPGGFSVRDAWSEVPIRTRSFGVPSGDPIVIAKSSVPTYKGQEEGFSSPAWVAGR